MGTRRVRLRTKQGDILMKPLIKFILYLSLMLIIITTHVGVATEFYKRGEKKGYEKGVGDAAYYMYTICNKGSNVYFNGNPTAYYCAEAIKL
jgi:hypothetical protein